MLTPIGPKALLPIRELKAAAEVHVGDAVSVVGAPVGLTMYRTDGYIASLNGLNEGYISTSAAAYGGNSGGPAVDSEGRLVGILVAGLVSYSHVSLLTPVSVIDALLDD